jgi:hypothetical protein
VTCTLRVVLPPAPVNVPVTVTGGDAVPASAAPKLIEPVGEIVAAACTAVPRLRLGFAGSAARYPKSEPGLSGFPPAWDQR